MYQRILVAVDDTELSQQAFQNALSMAKAFTAELKIIHVVSPLITEYQPNTSFALIDDFSDTFNDDRQEEFASLQERGWHVLRSFQEQAKKSGIVPDVTEEIGQPEQEITKLAQSWNADLIVIGSHGRKGISEFILGSVSNYVSHHVLCSVLLVHQPETAIPESVDL